MGSFINIGPALVFGSVSLLVACAENKPPPQQDWAGSLFGLFIIGWLLWFFGIRKSRAEAKKLKAQQQEQQRLEAEKAATKKRIEAEQKALEAKQKQEIAQQEAIFAAEQARLDDAALAARLRSAVSELVDFSNMLKPAADNSNILQAMHTTINNVVARHHELTNRHFNENMIQDDIQHVLRRLNVAGLGDDLVVERIKKAFRKEVPANRT